MERTKPHKSPFGEGVRRICAVAAAGTAREMIRQIREALRETPTVELRLDWLRNDPERAALLAWVEANKPGNATLLATCRRVPGGGRLRASVRAELDWLAKAREAGCAWCDLEIETFHQLKDQTLKDLKLPPHVLLSLHDFKGMPPLREALRSVAHPDAGAVKIAATAGTIQESLQLLRLARETRGMVAVPMGEAGLPARILALREGSALAYASVAAATAPGQISLQTFERLYRAHKITNRTAVYGVIANPVSHSLSPLLHNTGFIARGLDAVYLPFLVEDLRDFLKAVPELGIRGFSVTIPHKQAILKHLDQCEPLAEKIGAVNTVMVRRNGALAGSNTDYLGVLRALEKELHLPGSRVLIFGAGGAARAAAFALAQAGAAVFVCARQERAARELANAVECEAIRRRLLRSTSFDAILNTTPVGMHPHDGVSPLTARELNCRVVLDMINRPQETRLLQLAANKGIAAIPGINMFFAQGIAQWELWTGRRAPRMAMERAVRRFLRAEEDKARSSRLP